MDTIIWPSRAQDLIAWGAGWVAAVGGVAQLAWNWIMDGRVTGHGFAFLSSIPPGEAVSTFLTQIGPGITAFAGICILIYQQIHAVRRKVHQDDEQAYKDSLQGRLDRASQDLNVAKAAANQLMEDLKRCRKYRKKQALKNIELRRRLEDLRCPYAEGGIAKCFGEELNAEREKTHQNRPHRHEHREHRGHVKNGSESASKPGIEPEKHSEAQQEEPPAGS